jgi:hypothetical protein
MSPTPSADPPSPALPFAILLVVFCTLFLPVVLSGAGGTSEHADAVQYHLPIIEKMRADWPRVDVVRYDSATTPGFHVLMAALWKLTGSTAAMTATNSLLGVLLISSVFFAARRFAGAWGALALTLPLACSPYILGATIWLTTDNAALFFVTLALASATIARTTNARLIGAGFAAALAVSIRQVNVWLAAPLGFAGLIASPLAAFVPRIFRWDEHDTLAPRPRSMLNFIAGCIAAALPAAVLLYFVWQWGWQLNPVTADDTILKHNRGPNLASPAFALALTGALGVFFIPFAWRELRALRPTDPAAFAAAAIALALSLISPTSYYWTETWMPRSYGWLWRIVEKFPCIMERSIVITAAAPVGALILLLLFRAASAAGRRVPAAVLLLSLLGWLFAQTMNSMAWQRYFEPLITIALIWLASMTRATDSHSDGNRCGSADGTDSPKPADRWHVYILPLLLAAFQLGLCAITLYREVLADLGR